MADRSRVHVDEAFNAANLATHQTMILLQQMLNGQSGQVINNHFNWQSTRRFVPRFLAHGGFNLPPEYGQVCPQCNGLTPPELMFTRGPKPTQEVEVEMSCVPVTQNPWHAGAQPPQIRVELAHPTTRIQRHGFRDLRVFSNMTETSHFYLTVHERPAGVGQHGFQMLGNHPRYVRQADTQRELHNWEIVIEDLLGNYYVGWNNPNPAQPWAVQPRPVQRYGETRRFAIHRQAIPPGHLAMHPNASDWFTIRRIDAGGVARTRMNRRDICSCHLFQYIPRNLPANNQNPLLNQAHLAPESQLRLRYGHRATPTPWVPVRVKLAERNFHAPDYLTAGMVIGPDFRNVLCCDTAPCLPADWFPHNTRWMLWENFWDLQCTPSTHVCTTFMIDGVEVPGSNGTALRSMHCKAGNANEMDYFRVHGWREMMDELTRQPPPGGVRPQHLFLTARRISRNELEFSGTVLPIRSLGLGDFRTR